MRFELVPFPVLGLKDILAEGEINRDTPALFRAFVAKHGIHGNQIRLNSPGGDLSAALELGREIRRLGLDTLLAIPARPSSEAVPAETRIRRSGPPSETATTWADQLRPTLDSFQTAILGEKSRCVSACAYAFLGGVRRHLWWIAPKRQDPMVRADVPEAPRHFQDAGSDQNQLGYHLAVPDDIILRDARNRRRSLDREATAQKLAGDVALFLRDMGIGTDVLNFSSSAPIAASGHQGMYFPTIEELYRAGVLIQMDFTPFRVNAQDGGLALISLDRNAAVTHRQLSFACSNGAPTAPKPLSLVYSTGLTSAATRDRPVMLGGAVDEAPDASRMKPSGSDPPAWHIILIVDGRRVGDSAKSAGFTYASRASGTGFNAFHRRFDLPEEAVRALADGHRFKIYVNDFPSYELAVDTEIPDQLKLALPILRRNCLDLPELTQAGALP